MNRILSLQFKVGLAVVAFLISSCSPKLNLSSIDQSLYPITSELPKDEKIAAFLIPYKQQLDSQMNQVIAISAIEISRAKPEGLLNNLVADAMADAAVKNGIPFDLAFTNYGGLRIALPKDEIRLYKVYELMPFENLLATVNFSGIELMSLFEYIANSGGDPISGARFVIRDKKPIDITIAGKPLDLTGTYTVLTSDYMANGGDQASFFKNGSARKEYDIKLRDAIISYLKQFHKAGNIINLQQDGRITFK